MVSNNKCCWCFSILLLIEILDKVCDWFFYVDVSLVEKGLVFGPHEPRLVTAVLVFTIFGSLAFPVQVFVTRMETLYKEKAMEHQSCLDIISLIILIIEDIPQAVLLLLVSLCREDPSSMWGISKASFLLLTSLIKTSQNVVGCCNSKHFFSLKTIVAIGAMLEMGISVVVFLATQSELSNGNVIVNKPTTLVDDRYNDMYFSDVSLFIHDPNIIPSRDLQSQRSSSIRWFRLDELRHIEESGHISIRMEYQKEDANVTKLHLWQKVDHASSWVSNGCYKISSNGNVPLAPCSLSDSSNLYITLKYIKPDKVFKKHVMGDIVFNAKYKEPGGGQISDMKSSMFSDSVWTDNSENIVGRRINNTILLHYFRHSSANGGEEKRLYRNDKSELEDVKDIWKTGWLKCQTTGNVAPRFDDTIKVYS